MLLCLVVCLTLLASFFLPSHLSLKHVIIWLSQVLTSSSTDNIHRVTINAANDMLSESDLQTTITSLSGTQPLQHQTRPRPSPHPSLLAPATPILSSQHHVTPIPLVIEPELVEPGALQGPSSLTVAEGAMQNLPSLLTHTRHEAVRDLTPLASVVASTQGSVQNPSSSSSLLANMQGGEAQNAPLLLSTAQVRQLHQLQQQLEPQLSNILVQGSDGGVGPEQYIVQVSSALDIGTATTSGTHTVTLNPSSQSHASTVRLSSLVPQGAGLPVVAKSNQLSGTMLTPTPIDATLQQVTGQSTSEVPYHSGASLISSTHTDTFTSS